MALNGALPQRITSCFQSLDILMNQSEPVVSSFVPVEKNLGSQSSGQSVVETVCKILGTSGITKTYLYNFDLP